MLKLIRRLWGRTPDGHGYEPRQPEPRQPEPRQPSEPELDPTEPEVVSVPLDGELDLHTFRPAEVPDLVREYVRACREEGVLGLRIVHGKGKGTLRRSVHAVLADMPEVVHYRLAESHRGGWGATLVDVAPLDEA